MPRYCVGVWQALTRMTRMTRMRADEVVTEVMFPAGAPLPWHVYA